MDRRKFAITAGALIACMAFTQASAQKAKDTVRIGIHQPVSTIDLVFDPSPQTSLLGRMVFDNLIYFDPVKKELQPGLAQSWKRIDEKTVEFRLRQGVKFHNGDDFSADDVVYTFNFIMDPNTRFRFKDSSYGWLDKAEKIDQFTVRISTKAPMAPFEARLVTTLPIFPHKHHSALPDRAAFGRTPIGTGPYRALQVDTTKGVIFERFDGFKHGGPGKPPGAIRRVEIFSIPEEQTRLAKAMIGELDLIYDVTPDVAENFRANPQISITNRPTNAFAYLMLDAIGRSGIEYFKDRRVREAIMRGVDRNALVKALQPAEIAALPLQKSMCHPWNIGCAQSTEPPSYDPALAKKLLAEAGYPNGFRFTLGTWGASRPVAEALAGQLRQIGVTVTLDAMALPAFVKKRAAGDLNAYAVIWDNSVGAPDVDNTAGFFYSKSDRNYDGDAELNRLYHAAQQEFDLAKRTELYRQLFDRVNEQRYSMPLIPLAGTLIHSSDLVIPPPGSTYTEGFAINLLRWK